MNLENTNRVNNFIDFNTNNIKKLELNGITVDNLWLLVAKNSEYSQLNEAKFIANYLVSEGKYPDTPSQYYFKAILGTNYDVDFMNECCSLYIDSLKVIMEFNLFQNVKGLSFDNILKIVTRANFPFLLRSFLYNVDISSLFDDREKFINYVFREVYNTTKDSDKVMSCINLFPEINLIPSLVSFYIDNLYAMDNMTYIGVMHAIEAGGTPITNIFKKDIEDSYKDIVLSENLYLPEFAKELSQYDFCNSISQIENSCKFFDSIQDTSDFLLVSIKNTFYNSVLCSLPNSSSSDIIINYLKSNAPYGAKHLYVADKVTSQILADYFINQNPVIVVFYINNVTNKCEDFYYKDIIEANNRTNLLPIYIGLAQNTLADFNYQFDSELSYKCVTYILNAVTHYYKLEFDNKFKYFSVAFLTRTLLRMIKVIPIEQIEQIKCETKSLFNCISENFIDVNSINSILGEERANLILNMYIPFLYGDTKAESLSSTTVNEVFCDDVDTTSSPSSEITDLLELF